MHCCFLMSPSCCFRTAVYTAVANAGAAAFPAGFLTTESKLLPSEGSKWICNQSSATPNTLSMKWLMIGQSLPLWLDFLKPDKWARRRNTSRVSSMSTWMTIWWNVNIKRLSGDAKKRLHTINSRKWFVLPQINWVVSLSAYFLCFRLRLEMGYMKEEKSTLPLCVCKPSVIQWQQRLNVTSTSLLWLSAVTAS